MTAEFTKAHSHAAIFPITDGQPLWDLSDRIKANGLREPIVLLDGLVLDGRRREMACYRAGIKPKYRQFGSRKEDGDDPLEFVIDINLHRRHLGDGDRALAAARYATARVGNPNLQSVPKEPIGNAAQTKKAAAEKFDISESEVKRAKKVIASGTEKLQEAVAKDEITVTDAAKVAAKSPAVQDHAVGEVKSGNAKTATQAADRIEPPKPKSGKPKFDEKRFDKVYGALVRLVDERGNAMGKGPRHKKCQNVLGDFLDEYKAWKKETA